MTVAITPELLSDLEAKARAAMSGPWRVDTLGSVMASDGQFVALTTRYAHRYIPSRPNAAHIAAASPDVVLALVAELRRREAMCEWLARLMEEIDVCPLESRGHSCRGDCARCVLKAARKAVEGK